MLCWWGSTAYTCTAHLGWLLTLGQVWSGEWWPGIPARSSTTYSCWVASHCSGPWWQTSPTLPYGVLSGNEVKISYYQTYEHRYRSIHASKHITNEPKIVLYEHMYVCTTVCEHIYVHVCTCAHRLDCTVLVHETHAALAREPLRLVVESEHRIIWRVSIKVCIYVYT